MARRLRQVIDLYSRGRVVELRDGSPVWVQPMNPFEVDTARGEAQVARTRLALAIRTEGSDERDGVKVWFNEDGREAAIDRLVAGKISAATPKIIESVRNDPEWSERMQILDRGGEETATPLEEAEEKLLLRISNEFAAELGLRLANERDYHVGQFEQMDDEVLWEAYLDWYIDERTSDVLMAEYRLYQVYFGARLCNGRHVDGEAWDHSECNGHRERLFEDPTEVREAPAELLQLMYIVADDVDMSARDAKNSDRQGSSSGSSPLPSEGEASTPSTPSEIQHEPRGSSSSPSPTPSPSSAGAS